MSGSLRRGKIPPCWKTGPQYTGVVPSGPLGETVTIPTSEAEWFSTAAAHQDGKGFTRKIRSVKGSKAPSQAYLGEDRHETIASQTGPYIGPQSDGTPRRIGGEKERIVAPSLFSTRLPSTTGRPHSA